MERHLEIDKGKKTLSSNKLTKGNMLKYFEKRRIKKQKELEKEFDLAFKKFMREEKLYA